MVSSFCAFVVGIITCATVGQGTMDAGNSYEMYAVAASVIGGVSTLGGQGILLGTVVGAAIWGTLQNVCSLLVLQWQSVISSSASSLSCRF